VSTAPEIAPAVVLYATGWCPYCERARQLLRSKGAAFQEIDIEAQPDKRVEMQKRSGRSTVPQIFVGGTHIGGCDELYELDAGGGLDSLLAS
jgi:glutaredoxin 3